MAAAAIGIVTSIAGQQQAAQARKGAARRNANALSAQGKAQREQAEREAVNFARESEIVFGDKVSSFAKAGVNLSGSALAVLAQTKEQQLADEKQIRQNGLDAAGVTAAKAAQQRSAGRDAIAAGNLRSAGSILTGIGEFVTSKSGSKSGGA